MSSSIIIAFEYGLLKISCFPNKLCFWNNRVFSYYLFQIMGSSISCHPDGFSWFPLILNAKSRMIQLLRHEFFYPFPFQLIVSLSLSHPTPASIDTESVFTCLREKG